MRNEMFTVSFKRVIAVNSANFAYVEVPLDDNRALLGTGNLGKSSIVNCVRFFLLPEVNLNDSDKKFAFISGAGDSADVKYFNKNEIYDYYFPDEHSRLILEVEHRLIGGSTRRHCQIISKLENFRIERCFIQEPYDAIEHLFWDKTHGVAGGRPTQLVGKQLLSTLKSINSGAKQFNQVEQLEQALYKVNVLQPNMTPFVVFPMNEQRANAVDSLRALVKMLFNQDSRSLRLITATAVEGHDDSGQALEVDIGHIISEQQYLKDRKSALDRLKDSQPKYESMKDHYQTLSQENEVANTFAQYWVNLKAYKSSLTEIASQLASKQNDAENKVLELSGKLSILEKDRYSHEKMINVKEREIQNNQSSVQKCNTICSPYANLSVEEVLEILQEELQKQNTMLELYTDQNARLKRIAELDVTIKSLQNKLDVLEKRKTNSAYSLDRQLDRTVWKKLYSANKYLADANPGRALLKKELDSLVGYSELMTIQGPKLFFFDAQIEFNSGIKINDIDSQIDKSKEEIEIQEKERKKLMQVDTDRTLHDVSRISKIQQEIKLLNDDVAILSQYQYFQKRLSELAIEKNILSNEFEKLIQQLADLSPKNQLAKDELFRLKNETNTCQEGIRKLTTTISNQEHVLLRFSNVKLLIDSLAKSTDFDVTNLQSEEFSKSLIMKLENIARVKDLIKNELRNLIISGIISDDYNLLEEHGDEKSIIDTFESLTRQYELLPDSYDVLTRETKIHNDHVRNRLERLSKTKEKIELTIKKINEELHSAKINDLEAVKLEVDLNAHFDDLIESWRSFDDMSGEGTLPDEWYIRLQKFLKSDAVNPIDGKLRMDNIIQHARYCTKKIGETWDTKDQSTSTKMLINTHLCDIFIQRLSSDTSHIAFPIVIDEIGKVSSEQFPSVINGLNEKGHWLIGVTTHGKSADLIIPFKNYLIMDELKTGKPYNKSRLHVCFTIGEESIKAKPLQTLFEVFE
ncbi:hypothetical protein L5L78_23215 [Shewanella sp. SM34]|uniref:hypothetical protein n=1 Tax=unclassified Shewanella TaxID=196818 RepID=UPI0021DA32B3|nr:MULTISPECIES: hypothetical protein [unclassified Shewanella]MCU8059063.1 hypothetical protein [Shewanella sp. SM35]MCU8067980.1 hypothetical protein [Shewanella sp. SM34]